MSQRRIADCHNQIYPQHRLIVILILVLLCVCVLCHHEYSYSGYFLIFDVSLHSWYGHTNLLILICSFEIIRVFVVVVVCCCMNMCVNHLNVQLMSSCHAMVLDFRCLTSNNLFHTIYGLHDLQHRAQYALHCDINTESFIFIFFGETPVTYSPSPHGGE